MISHRRHPEQSFWDDNEGGDSASGCHLTADKRVHRRKCSNDDRERDSSGCRQRITCRETFHRRCRRWQNWCCAGSTCNYALLVVIYVCCYLMTRTSPILAADVVAVAPIDSTISNTKDINVFKNNINNVTVVLNDINVNNNKNNNTKRPTTTTTTQIAVKLKSVQQGIQSADVGSSTGSSADEDDYYFDDKDDLEYHLLISNKSGR